MSNSQQTPEHNPKAFNLSLTRNGDNCCHTCIFTLPEGTMTAYPGIFEDPLRDLLRVAACLLGAPETTYLRGGDPHFSFEWDCEAPLVNWKFRPPMRNGCFHLIITEKPNDPEIIVHADTYLDAREFGRQVLREASRLMHEAGISCYDRHGSERPEYPIRDFIRLHEIVTGEPKPNTFKEELALLSEIAKGSSEEKLGALE